VGKLKFLGKRNDLLDVKKAIDDGQSVGELWQDHFANMVRYGRSLVTYKRIKTEPRSLPPTVIVFWGPTGTGKSRTAMLLASYIAGRPENVYVAPAAKSSGRYYDDYDGHSVIVYDEFYGGSMQWSVLLQVLDRYENLLPTHGGAGRQNVASTIIFTSNKHPFFWYNNEKINWTPLCRRLSLIVKIGTYAPASVRSKVPCVEVSSYPVGWKIKQPTAVGFVGRFGRPKKKTVLLDGVMYEEK